MSVAQNVLDELEAIGVLGNKPAPKPAPPAPVSEPTPPSGPQDNIRLHVMEHCARAVDLLERSIEAQMELREVFVALHGLCEGGNGDEENEEAEEPQEAEDEPHPAEVSLEDNEEQHLPQTDSLVVIPPAVPLVSEEPPEESPLLQETQVSNLDTGSAVQDLIAQNDLAYRRETRAAAPIPGEDVPIVPPRSLDSALSTVAMPAARRAFLAEMKDAAEGKTKKNRVS
jgi:hypothetical protein